MGCNCEDSESTDRVRLKKIAERSLRLAMALPDELTCRKNFKAQEAEFLSALRNLAVSVSMAHTWSESDIRSQLDSFRFTDAVMNLALPLDNNGGGNTDTNCTSRCQQALDSCNADCDSYVCNLDRRVAYYACIAQCVLRGVGVEGSGFIY